MGKIIRNGIEFCGTSDTADNIIYDNKDSGLESTTTQGAIDELSEKVKTGGNVVYLTQEQYDNLPDSKLTDNVEYRVTDAGTMAGAENVGYDNSKSGLEAVNVQDAIDGLSDSLEQVETLNFLNNSVILKRKGKMRVLNIYSLSCTYGASIPELNDILSEDDFPSYNCATMGTALVDGTTRTYYSFLISLSKTGVISGYAITGSNSFIYPQNYNLSGILVWFVD